MEHRFFDRFADVEVMRPFLGPWAIWVLMSLGSFGAEQSLALGAMSGDAPVAGVTVGVAKAKRVPGKKAQRYVVKLGEMITQPKHQRLNKPLADASRQVIGELPGVQLLDEAADAEREASRRRRPVVLVSGQLRELGSARVGPQVVLSARVEYVVYRVPGRSIAAVVAGSARTRVKVADFRSPADRRQLEVDLVQAAVESAARRANSAFAAAVR